MCIRDRKYTVNLGQFLKVIFYTLQNSHSLTVFILYHCILFERFCRYSHVGKRTNSANPDVYKRQIHGRAAAIATGAKVANPNLTIWQISGDGDGLAPHNSLQSPLYLNQ